jgi:hypothetical protein
LDESGFAGFVFLSDRKDRVAIKHKRPWISYKIKPSGGCAPAHEVKDCFAIVPGASKRASRFVLDYLDSSVIIMDGKKYIPFSAPGMDF